MKNAKDCGAVYLLPGYFYVAPTVPCSTNLSICSEGTHSVLLFSRRTVGASRRSRGRVSSAGVYTAMLALVKELFPTKGREIREMSSYYQRGSLSALYQARRGIIVFCMVVKRRSLVFSLLAHLSTSGETRSGKRNLLRPATLTGMLISILRPGII